MARLTPEQLQEARRRSGNLGGRPAKATVAEARTEALARLVPKAIRVLEEHLDSGRPDAWRSAVRVLEHSWGRPPEHVAPGMDGAQINADALKEMPTAQLMELVQRHREARDGAAPSQTESLLSPTADAE
jgi:hypothetical protein